MTMTKLLVATGALMVLNTLAIGGMLFLAFAAMEEVRSAEDQVSPILDFLNNPSTPESRTILHAVSDSASTFVLGPITGHVGYLADSLLRTDFGALGRAVEYFAGNVTAAVATSPHCSGNGGNSNGNSGAGNSPHGNSTTNSTPGNSTHANNPHGNSAGSAGLDFCLDPYLQTIVGAMQSVASKVKLLGAIQPNYPPGTPALDGGVFGLNGLFRFVKAQMNSSEWHTAGTVCQAFKYSVRNVSWTGSYRDAVDNKTVSFNWNSTVTDVFSDGGFIDQLCDAMKHMGS